jgi:hypothetical protein
MTSVLNVDTIADKAGTGPVALTKQSAAKAWFVYDQAADTIDNSISISSISDTSTGVFTSNFLNTFSAKPCPVGMCSYFSFCNTRNVGGDAITTSDTDFNISNSSAVVTDRDEISVSFHGDLA